MATLATETAVENTPATIDRTANPFFIGNEGESMSIQAWMKQCGFDGVMPEIGYSNYKKGDTFDSEKHYPFVTFLNSTKRTDGAECIWFSKGAADTVRPGDKVSRELFSNLNISFSVNANGEPRIKLGRVALTVNDLF